MSDDHSPGDRRQPYFDRGGPEGRHAETHDVRREELTNPVGPHADDPSFAEQLAPAEMSPGGGHVGESAPAAEDKVLHRRLPELSSDELSRLQVLEPGTRLEQGGTYLDLNRLVEGPFKALGGHEASDDNRYIAKRDTDYELWNRLVGEDTDPEIERPCRRVIGLQRHSVPRCFGSEGSVQWMSPNYADPGTKLENRVPGRTKTPDVGDTLIS